MVRYALTLLLATMLMAPSAATFAQNQAANPSQQAKQTDYKPPPDDWKQPSGRNCNNFSGCSDDIPSLTELKSQRAHARSESEAKLEAASKAVRDALMDLIEAQCAGNADWLAAYKKLTDAILKLQDAIDSAAQISEDVEPAQAATDAADRARAYYGSRDSPQYDPVQLAKAENAYVDADKRRDDAYQSAVRKLRAKYGFVDIPPTPNCPQPMTSAPPATQEGPKNTPTKVEVPQDKPSKETKARPDAPRIIKKPRKTAKKSNKRARRRVEKTDHDGAAGPAPAITIGIGVLGGFHGGGGGHGGIGHGQKQE